VTGRQHLTLDEIRQLLTEVGSRLQDRGVTAEVLVLGGAAVAMLYNQRRVTADVDVAVRGARETLMEVAKELATERGLPPEWLNSNASAWLPPTIDPDWPQRGRRLGGLTVTPADPRILTAMKMIAGRERDVPDLVVLFRHMNVRTAEEVVHIVRQAYPDGLPAREVTDEELLLDAADLIRAAWAADEPVE